MSNKEGAILPQPGEIKRSERALRAAERRAGRTLTISLSEINAQRSPEVVTDN